MMKSYDLNLWDSIFPFQIDPNGKFTNLLWKFLDFWRMKCCGKHDDLKPCRQEFLMNGSNCWKTIGFKETICFIKYKEPYITYIENSLVDYIFFCFKFEIKGVINGMNLKNILENRGFFFNIKYLKFDRKFHK
jgi:hypothetical protein